MSESASANIAAQCVLCGEANECGIAAGNTECWCFATPVPRALIERVPESQRNRACICQACVALYRQQHPDE